MVNSYESMYVLRPDLSEEQVDRVVQKYIEFIAEKGATNIKIQNRGKRRLAYEIENFQDGIYVQMNYRDDGQFIKPMERDMRLSEEVIRYLNLKIETDDLEEAPEEDSVSSDREQPPQEQPVDEQPPQEQPA